MLVEAPSQSSKGKRFGSARKRSLWTTNSISSVKISVLGCAVNGPGEAREADIGIAGGAGEGLLFPPGDFDVEVSAHEAIDDPVVTWTLARDHSIDLEVTVPAGGMSWYSFWRP